MRIVYVVPHFAPDVAPTAGYYGDGVRFLSDIEPKRKELGIRDEDLMFDPLVLPISTGIEEDRRNALETIEGTRRISRELPKCHTVVVLAQR